MKVCGFSFIRNAIKYDYPIAEALHSILPLCDQIYVAVGESEDDTRNLVAGISDKIVIIDTVWSDIRKGGRALAIETDKAYAAIANSYDWCIYIQGDEVIHESDYPEIRAKMQTNLNDEQVEGLLFNYHHFYGSFDYLATSGKWYDKEIRVVRHLPDLFSYGDAMGFRIKPNRKLDVKPVDAYIYHYGWVKHPAYQQAKQLSFNKLWLNDEELSGKVDADEQYYDYEKIDRVKLFKGTHPVVMESRIERQNWKVHLDTSSDHRTFLEKMRSGIEQLTGWRPGKYRNYKLLK